MSTEFSVPRVLALLPLVVLAACGSDAGDANRRANEILVVPVDRLQEVPSYSAITQFAGRVEAPRQSLIGFELGGEIAAIEVEEGDVVAAGDMLARLDRARLRTARREAAAALDQAVASAGLAKATLERTEEARSFDGVSAQELDQARQAAAAADAAKLAAEAVLARIDVDLEQSVLRAPYAARVVRRAVDEGVIVAAGQPVLGLEETGPREVRIGVSAAVASGLEPGSLHTLSIGDRPVEAQLRAVVPSRDPVTRTLDAIFVLDDSASFPGDLARLKFSRNIDDRGFWLPLNALTEANRGLWSVYVVEPASAEDATPPGASHRLSPRAVEVLHQTEDAVFARGALETGELYVTDGLHRIVAGQYVRLGSQSDVRDVDVAEVP
ncbi:MAG: efflux RND transporter periplasmic adaptor subunit [Pseudomonadota bacterium]